MAPPKIVKVNGEWKVVTEAEYHEHIAQAVTQDLDPLLAGAEAKAFIKDVQGSLPPGLKASIGGSFSLAVSGVVPRLIIGVDGLEKQGKTNFALTMPGPIAYQGTDIGLEGVVQKFQTTKSIHVAEYGFIINKGDDQAAVIAKAVPEWDRFLADYKSVMIPGFKKKTIRSGVWDTGSELWELERLARVGKLTQVMPHHYTALNQEYAQLIKEAYTTPGNLMILHKLKAEWKDNPTTGKGNKTGAYERSGFSGTGFLVQVNVTAWRDTDGEFHITVKDCRQNPAIAGQDFAGPLAAFPYLAVAVYPQTQLEDWM